MNLYAIWGIDSNVCKIGDTVYNSLQEAVDSIATSDVTTITLFDNAIGAGVKTRGWCRF